jgi:ABC-type antimicrobial peptide transport system permease subunit
MNSVLYLLGSNTESLQNAPGMVALGATGVIITFLLGVIYCYGAAMLSYNYNMSIGNGGYAMIWAILCYFFSGIYYPYYALFLNPLNNNNTVMVGGRKKY